MLFDSFRAVFAHQFPYGPAKSVKLLGGIERNLIKSITAISAPHNGTTLTEVVTKTIPFIQYFVGIAGVVGTQFYNFDLAQWNFHRKED